MISSKSTDSSAIVCITHCHCVVIRRPFCGLQIAAKEDEEREISPFRMQRKSESIFLLLDVPNSPLRHARITLDQSCLLTLLILFFVANCSNPAECRCIEPTKNFPFLENRSSEGVPALADPPEETDTASGVTSLLIRHLRSPRVLYRHVMQLSVNFSFL